MKLLYAKRALLIAVVAALLGVTAFAVAEQADIEPVSGHPMGKEGEIEMFYQERFEEVYRRYENELSENERFCSPLVYDGIACMSFRSEAWIPARERIFKISSADDLHAVLTGFFDRKDPTYNADDALLAKLQTVFDACGLNLEDYYFRVERNPSAIAAPFTPAETTWACGFLRKDKKVGIDPDDIEMVLHGEEMQVGRFVMDPWVVRED